MTYLYTSDSHFGHKNIIKYSKRPFNSVEEMDNALIKNWNSVVKPDDHVFHLGDFSFYKDSEWILNSLNGIKTLIHGNHDSEAVRSYTGWSQSTPYLEINDNGQIIILCHFAFRVWNKSHHKSLSFYGHSHGNLPGTDQSIDVGVDAGWNYTPVTLKQIREKLKTLPPYRQEDHHKSNG